ncbi:uncharacterized protein C17orf50 homolog [Hyperolius riggenbachi]|uniref:uncharacterized protein C17orf50 homolog n=1 Tax=Hyperolius riggenbachi TaxID=752182 RepID=UPI0035A32F31
MSGQNKKPWNKENEVATSGDRGSRKKRERIIRKKIVSLAVLCGSLKTPKVKTHAVEDKKKPMRRLGHREQRATQEEAKCAQLQHSRKMCAKCEIITCRKCDTLHADSLFVAHSLLDHYDHRGCT